MSSLKESFIQRSVNRTPELLLFTGTFVSGSVPGFASGVMAGDPVVGGVTGFATAAVGCIVTTLWLVVLLSKRQALTAPRQ
jgi:hypothetical protein